LATPERLILRQIESGDKTTGLSLGDKESVPLKTFLRKCALEFHRGDIGKTYVLVSPDEDAPRIWAYITLMCSEISLGDSYSLDDCTKASQYKVFPAIKIARLAVDSQIQGIGYGTALIDWSVSLAKKDFMPWVGCRFVILDAKELVVNFYESSGFTMLDTKMNRKSKHPVMFIDLHKLK